ncbi:LCP family protein [Ectobacillus funiculus]|uniref:LCP family protein n=1 Tax=Ectobacillus funiculus TaxID=137993 RepID=UPI00397BCF56
MKDRHQYIQERKRVKRRRRRIALVTILLVIIGGVGYGAYSYLRPFLSLANIYSGSDREKSKLRTEEAEITKKPFSILLTGVEDYATGGKNGRTDSIIFATINPKTKHVTILSIPRDTRVNISGRDKLDKINAAHAYGGIDMTMNTVEDFLNVPVDHYVEIGFEGFKKIVDAVNGVTVDVPFDFVEGSDLNPRKGISFHKGSQHLNGEEALAYVRMRKHDPMGDFGRAQRQRQVLGALVEKLNSPSVVTKLDDIAEIIGKHVKTDIPVSDGLALYQKFSGFKASSIETLRLDGDDDYINGIYYYIPKKDSQQEIHDKLWKTLDLPPESSSSSSSDDSESNEEE